MVCVIDSEDQLMTTFKLWLICVDCVTLVKLGCAFCRYFEDVTEFAGVRMDGYGLRDLGVDGWFTFCASFTVNQRKNKENNWWMTWQWHSWKGCLIWCQLGVYHSSLQLKNTKLLEPLGKLLKIANSSACMCMTKKLCIVLFPPKHWYNVSS